MVITGAGFAMTRRVRGLSRSAGSGLLLLVLACTGPDDATLDARSTARHDAGDRGAAGSDTARHVDDSLIVLNGLRPEMHGSEVLALLGAPLSIRPVAETTGRFVLDTWRYTDLTVLFADGRLAGATCTDACVLPRGIAIGWSRRDVEAAWEVPPVLLAVNHPNSIMYPAALLHCGLVFDFFDDRLATARLWCNRG